MEENDIDRRLALAILQEAKSLSETMEGYSRIVNFAREVARLWRDNDPLFSERMALLASWLLDEGKDEDEDEED